MSPLAARVLIAAALAATSFVAVAEVTTYSSRTSFENLSSPGTLISYGFDNINTSATGYLHLSNPFVANGVTYSTGGNNLAIDVGAGNVFTSDAPLGSAGFVSGAFADNSNYSLLGFDLGGLTGATQVNISLNTNLGTYNNFLSVNTPAAPTTSFLGFAVGSSEHFTSFRIAAVANDMAPVLDNVTLGLAVASPVPEPGALAMLTPGLLLLVFAARSRI